MEHDKPGRIVVLSKEDNKVYERLAGNKFWWTVGSLKAHKTEEIEGPVEILLYEESNDNSGEPQEEG